MKRQLFLLSATAMLFIAAGCVKTTNTAKNSNTDSRSVSASLVIFYEQQTILGFEPGGTPHGTSILYRKDGISSRPTVVSSRGDEHNLGSTEYSVKGGKLEKKSLNNSGAWTSTQTTTMFDFSGTKMAEDTAHLQNGLMPASLTNNDSSMTATATMACSETVDAGPCPITFHLKIVNNTAKTEKTLEQKDFPNTVGTNYRAEPVAFTGDDTQLIVYITQVGDFINPASFNIVNLSDYSVTQPLKANYPNPKDPSNVDRLNFIRASADGTAIWAERDFGDQVATGELLKITVSPWSVEKVADITPIIESFEVKPDGSGVIQQVSSGGFSYLDLATGLKKVLADQGYFLGWSHDGQYYLYRVYDDNGNGLGPYRLMVGSMTTGTQTEIVRQSVTAQSVKTTTKVGDILYAPVGIW